MINKDIIRLASNTSNVGLRKKYSHKISLKNSTCGDKITLELIADKKKISSMKYETISCVYCEASASLISRKIKNVKLKDVKNDLITLKKISINKNVKIPIEHIYQSCVFVNLKILLIKIVKSYLII